MSSTLMKSSFTNLPSRVTPSLILPSLSSSLSNQFISLFSSSSSSSPSGPSPPSPSFLFSVSHINNASYPVPTQSRAKSPMEYIAEIPPIEVDGLTAVCDGGDARLGHPIEYIQLNKVDPTHPETCKYCGLRFIQKNAHHH